MSRRHSMTFGSTFAAAASMRWSRVAAESVDDITISSANRRIRSTCRDPSTRVPLRDRTAQRLGFVDELLEPLGEVRLALLLGQAPRARGHVDELIDEGAQVLADAEEDQGGGLVLD